MKGRQMLESRFTQFFMLRNGLSHEDFSEWLFHPDMLHRALGKWWGDLGRRITPHEGVDVTLYRDKAGAVHQLASDTGVPAMYDGTILSIIPDLLGKTVVLEHESDEGLFLTIYGHLIPADAPSMGALVAQGDILGTAAGPQGRTPGLLPHVHITLAKVLGNISCSSLDWHQIATSPLFVLKDPLPFLGGRYIIRDTPLPI
jgi:hypothetical protein